MQPCDQIFPRLENATTVKFRFLPDTRRARYTPRNQAKLKLKLNTFGRLNENLSDSSSKGIARHIRIPVNEISIYWY